MRICPNPDLSNLEEAPNSISFRRFGAQRVVVRLGNKGFPIGIPGAHDATLRVCPALVLGRIQTNALMAVSHDMFRKPC